MPWTLDQGDTSFCPPPHVLIWTSGEVEINNPFPRLRNLCTLCLASQALAQWLATWGRQEASASLRRGMWGIITPSSHSFPPRTPAAWLTLGHDRPVLLNFGCPKGFPGTSLTWVSEGLSWPQSPSLGSPERNIEVFQKPRGAGLDILTQALPVSPSHLPPVSTTPHSWVG